MNKLLRCHHCLTYKTPTHEMPSHFCSITGAAVFCYYRMVLQKPSEAHLVIRFLSGSQHPRLSGSALPPLLPRQRFVSDTLSEKSSEATPNSINVAPLTKCLQSRVVLSLAIRKTRCTTNAASVKRVVLLMALRQKLDSQDKTNQIEQRLYTKAYIKAEIVDAQRAGCQYRH